MSDLGSDIDPIESREWQDAIADVIERDGAGRAHYLLDRAVQQARAAMLALNPHIQVTALARRITGADMALIGEHDLVIDGTDTFAARQAINAACVAAGVPLVAGAIAQWEGQVTVWDPARGAPCMACIFPDAPAPGL